MKRRLSPNPIEDIAMKATGALVVVLTIVVALRSCAGVRIGFVESFAARARVALGLGGMS